MTDLQPCIRCERPIDRFARICVYCSWDQNDKAVPPPAVAQATTGYVPPPDNRPRNRVIAIVGGVALVILAFSIGAWMPSDDRVPERADPKSAVAGNAAPASTNRANVTLVPATDALSPALEQPITTAPAQTPGQDPNDATAMPSDQYAAAAAQVKEAKQKRTEADPRELRGRAFETPPPVQRATTERPAEPAPAAERETPMASAAPPPPPLDRSPDRSRVSRTEAFPEYKPLPHIAVDQDTTARLVLTVGADGRVKDVNISDPIPGATSKIIDAVQSWRFRPATENGTPVSARVAVTITLHANE